MQIGSGIQQRNHLHVKRIMSRVSKIIIPVFIIAMLWMACAPKIYQPPHLGAEYRFDEGLKPKKTKQQLFSKGMHQYLRETGVEQSPSSGSVSSATKTPKDSTSVIKETQHTLHKDTLTTPAPASLPASPDSSHSVQH